ncbi:CsgG/HfaB family protein [Pontibacter mangrovi]|uniref:Curli production assembly/transport component CsgG n=1 Tax=Pontibacter mangrovi TaxID=2589816 RepID=A0A501WFU0_9BACT|nr:CsgG/HfaB family protein [Pontibacter mangrovi]TPE44396.1 curli production assembly/transport component CsgG [Pontibacter mangrovi]
MTNKLFTYIFSICCAFWLSLLQGCSPYFHQPMQSAKATLGPPSPAYKDLVSLPQPQQKVVAAVYKFRDQTGQYKPSEVGTSWSTAVTQGATTILINSLEESGWFTPIERENLGNLLNERKIIRSTRAEAEAITGKKEPNLPGLLFAGIILEGGIISYDANVVTGGAGLRYFGAGGSGQYREDKVTVYLRAISTSTGEILKTVYTTKTILSQAVDFGVFRYVHFKRLLEAETGFTYNEPSEIAVKEAIDKAVQSMVIEGMLAGFWRPKNKEDLESQVVRDYLQEKEDILNSDIHGNLMAERRSLIGVSGAIGAMYYKGDFPGPEFKFMGEAGLRISSRQNIGLDLRLGKGQLATDNGFQADINYAELDLNYLLFPKLRYSPYAQVGAGGLVTGSFGDIFSGNGFNPYVKAGLGMEYLLTKKIGIDLNASSAYLLDDDLDEVEQGRFNDYFWTGKIGINFYLGQYK